MLPLIPLALSLVPELVRLIAGDKAGAVASDVAGAVQAVTGTSDRGEAQARLDANPALLSDLRIKLAQIALDSQRARDAADDSRRSSELEALRLAMADTAGARGGMVGLVRAGSVIAWGAPVVSVIVTAGFFLIIALLLWGRDPAQPFDPTVTSIVNLTIGALAASFATVVNFWLGSSQGSRDKDATMRDLHAAHLQQVQNPIISPPPTVAAPPPADRFDHCLSVVLDKEGGYTDNPADRGGPTQMGITLATLAEWRGRPVADVSADDVRNLTRREAAEIYRARYWLPVRGPDLPAGVDLMVFDFGVNAGPRNSVKLLQRAIGVTDDGSVGPRTLAALAAAPAAGLIEALAEARLGYYRSLDNFATFGAGWTNRTQQVAALAKAMA